ncbi:MAG: site-specific integrase [Varibaculum cambriense]|nr:site-specific integrase [Varibaculum cambriense]
MAREAFGQIKKLPSGRYRADFQHPDYIGMRGQRTRVAAPVTFTNKTAARAWLAEQRAMIEKGTWKSPEQLAEEKEAAARKAKEDSLTLGEFVEQYQAMRKPRVGTETYRVDASRWNVLKKDWEHVPIKSITTASVSTWLAGLDLSKRGWINKLAFFNQVLKSASDDFEIIDHNPAAKPIKKLKKAGKRIGTRSQRSKPNPFPVDELVLLADNINPPCLRLWILLGGLLGLRAGEMAGLTRSSFDFEKHEIIINKATTGTGKTKDPNAGVKTKTSNRRLAIPAGLETEIKKHLEAYAAFGKDGLVFPSPRNPYTSRDVTGIGQAMKRNCKRLGIAERTSHDLRHTAASLFGSAGVPILNVQAILGHAESSITRRYSHPYKQQKAEAIGNLWNEIEQAASAGGNVLKLPERKQA